MVIGLGAALLAAVLFGVAAVMQAVAARRYAGLAADGLVGLIYVLGWGLHLVSIAMVPLYVAQVGIAASLAVTALSPRGLCGEPLSRRHRIAVGDLVGGLALLALSAGPVGTHEFDLRADRVLYARLGRTLVIALGPCAPADRGGVSAGRLGGLAYAGSPIATRALVDPAWDADDSCPCSASGSSDCSASGCTPWPCAGPR